jgi:hypothetical protein
VSTLYEYYNTGDDSVNNVFGIYWTAQTFTPAVAHKITSVKLLLYRLGSPGTVTVSIRATDGSGHPTGGDLCSGTTDGNTLPTGSPYEWRETTLGDGYDLAASTKYAVVARAPGGDASNKVLWRRDGSDPTYAGGNGEHSFDSGSSWLTYTTRDYMFEEWGEAPAVTEKTSSDTGSGADALTSGNPVATLIKAETGSGSDVKASDNPQATLVKAETGSGVDVFVSLEQLEAKTSSDSGSGTEASTQTATLTKAETGTGVEGLLARVIGLTETGAGLDVVAQAQAILEGAEVGSGADAYVSLVIFEARFSSDVGLGVEGAPMLSAILAGSETGSSVDAIIARLLAVVDTGTGTEVSSLFQDLSKELFATELGQGIDALVVKREIFAGGEGTKFFGGGHEPPHRAS